MTFLAILILALLRQVVAVTVGHEQYGNIPGYFYIFAGSGISIVDPITGTVNKTIASTVTAYGDAVYLEDQAQLRHYVYAARSDENKMVVLDADTQTILTVVSVGQKPLHVYSLYYHDEVWVHNDLEGSFDVLRMAQVRYRSVSAIKPSTTVPGHGKLLFDPNLEDNAYATNVARGGLLKLSLSTRQITETILFKAAAGSPFNCSKTHGVSYSATDNSVYVECSSPICTTAGNKTCTGSIWRMKVSDKSTTRLSSPSLSKTYNSANYGMQGQPYRSPEGTFIFVPNTVQGMLHILKPMADGTTLIREVAVAKPGNVVFWPKDSTITYGLDANPENYIMAVNGLLGVYLLDLKTVVAAFSSTDGSISTSDITLIEVKSTGGYRSMKRGHNYVALGRYEYDTKTSKDVATGVAIVNLVTKTVKYLDISLYMSAVWVPIQSTENTAMIKSLQSKVEVLSESSASSTSSSSDNSKSSSLLTNNALIVAAIAFVMSLISLILITALALIVRGNKRAEGNLL